MSTKPVLQPGPHHPITIEPSGGRVVVTVAGQVVADSLDALRLQEATYPPVQYIPLKDVNVALLERSEHTSYCPFKGEASYFSIPAGGASSADAVWTYQSPHAAVQEIADHVAFYPDRVDSIAVEPIG